MMNARSFASATCAALVLTAAPHVFGQSPTPPVTPGTFNGLFQETELARHESSGFLSAKVTAKGSISGYLFLAGTRLPFSGRWPTNGSMPSIAVKRPGTNAVTLHLTPFDLDGIEGFVSDGHWLSPLLADRQVWHKTLHPATAFAGAYTTSIDRGAGSDHPNGFGFGTISVDVAGMVKLAGTLGDGTKVAQKTAVSAHGLWPFYVPAYGGKGSVFGWMPLSNSDHTSATVCWHKGNGVTGQRYPSGFGLTPPMYISPFVPPAAGNRVMNITQGYVALEGGSLPNTVVTELSLSPDNKIINLGQNQLAMAINPRTGLMTGAVNAPNGLRLKFSGIVFQAVDVAVGLFLGTNHSGSVVVAGEQ